MTPERLREILDGFPRVRVLIVGDLFLDKYLVVDPALAETSLETGLAAHQVVRVRTGPGAAGTVAANLSALEVGEVGMLAVVGEDGEGDDALRGLARLGVRSHLIRTAERMTPTYTKPMRREADGTEVEMNRFDHKNRTPLPEGIEDELIASLRRLVTAYDAVVLADQVEERNCGVVTDRLRDEIARLAEEHPDILFYADSRERIGEFRGCAIKPNLREAARAVDPSDGAFLTRTRGVDAARMLAERTGKTVFLTLGGEGMIVFEGGQEIAVPGVAVLEPTDPCGAGDSATAGIVASLRSGATPEEAAAVGNLVASLTVQQIGTTGTTTREAVRRRCGSL